MLPYSFLINVASMPLAKPWRPRHFDQLAAAKRGLWLRKGSVIKINPHLILFFRKTEILSP